MVSESWELKPTFPYKTIIYMYTHDVYTDQKKETPRGHLYVSALGQFDFSSPEPCWEAGRIQKKGTTNSGF